MAAYPRRAGPPAPCGVTDCTERHTTRRFYGLDGEGHEGTPREAQS
jgi:hypothetical protein